MRNDEKEPDVRYIGWPNGARVAVVIGLALEAWQKLPPVSTAMTPHFPQEALDRGLTDHATSTWQLYGGRTGFRRLRDVLAEYDCPGTLSLSALAAERWPEQVAQFVADGHEVMGHGYSQDMRMYFLDEEEERAEIRRCADIIQKVSGVRPVGWSSQGGQRSDNTPMNLLREGFIYEHDFRDTDVPYVVQQDGDARLLAMPGTYEVNDAMLLAKYGNAPSAYVEFFSRTFDRLYKEGETEPKMMTAIVHSTHFGKPFGAWALGECIRYAQQFDKVWFCRRRDIADWYLSAL
jgi:peptidoglycan/xylan/chitin deacetylase (PgdA/CDA1 family)